MTVSPGVPSISQTLRDTRLDRQERGYDAALDRYIPFVGLVVGTGVTVFIMPATSEYWVPTALLVAAAAAWPYWFALVPVGPAGADGTPQVRASRSRSAGLLHLVVMAVLTLLLVWRSPAFGFHAVAGYVHAFAFLQGRLRWAMVGVLGVAPAYAQMGGSFTGPQPTWTYLLALAALTLVNAALGGCFTYFGMLSSEQSARRRLVIEELARTNRRLSETLEENAALQARLLAQAREAGVVDERARLAREIHDTIAQGLTGIVTQLEAASAADSGEDPMAAVRRRHVETARSLARESLTEARRSVDALTPGRLAEARLPDAITEMAKRWAETASVEVGVDTTGEPFPLLPEIEVTLFRVAQEALANAGKHSGASRVGLTLSYMADVVVLDVVDDGAGFDPAAVRPDSGSGFGLPSMEQRVRRVSGTFTVESAPGEGTAVSATVPAIPAENEMAENGTTEGAT